MAFLLGYNFSSVLPPFLSLLTLHPLRDIGFYEAACDKGLVFQQCGEGTHEEIRSARGELGTLGPVSQVTPFPICTLLALSNPPLFAWNITLHVEGCPGDEEKCTHKHTEKRDVVVREK